jgi:Fe-S oxidoreductase
LSKRKIRFRDVSNTVDQPLVDLQTRDLISLDSIVEQPSLSSPKESWQDTYDFSLDGYSDFDLPKPETQADKDQFVQAFLSGLGKLFDESNNWTFLKVLKLSMDYCMRCQTCSDACHVYLASGKQEIYRPTFRSEVLRRIYQKHSTLAGKYLGAFVGADIDLNFSAVWRLLEMSYRCNICRRCAMVCPVGIDNALIAREIRKLFAQELGIAPNELFKKGTRAHLSAGSSTGMNPAGFNNTLEFIEEIIEEKTGRRIKVPVDKKGADILLIHNAGEFLSWPENPAAFSILFDAAGIDYTLSSDLLGYDAVNYGVWFDDVELSRVALRHVRIAQDLGVKKIIVGECGHAHKAICVVADRVLPGDLSLSEIPRESCLPLLRDIVKSGVIQLDPARNDFPVTLHDSCNVVRLMGIVRPQREIIEMVCAQPLREMTPHGVWNYCCGGGGGFAIMDTLNFSDWRNNVSARMKVQQTLNVFQDILDPEHHKYVIAACSNCKGTFRDAIEHYDLKESYGIGYTGLADVIVNAMVDLPEPYLEWDPFM